MKKSLVIALALMLVLAFANGAMAAQALQAGSYLSTTATGLDYNGAPLSTNTTFSRVYQASKFTVDGFTYYPYEIYLPNEKSPSSYRIHSNYAKNTDACASCHATHTAVGASLLQWYSVYETCMACHDGTLGDATYNVEEGKIGNTTASTFGGMFGDGTQKSLSNHNVTGSMEIAAAPGGTTVATEQVSGAHGAKETRWVTEFGCASCHSPHGQGGNARILHPDANYAASWAAEKRSTPNKYLTGAGGAVFADADKLIPVYIIKGYPYSPSVVGIDGNNVDKTLKIDNTSGSSIIKDAAGNPVVNANVYVLGVASLKVTMNVQNYLTAGETVDHVYGMNYYCGACHTDYNTAAFTGADATGAGSKETGVYAQAHRHQVGNFVGYFNLTKTNMVFESQTLECLTCHVAHGTSQDWWAATLNPKDSTYWPPSALDTKYAELAGSSALKRIPNMGTCEACHAKGDGSEGYNINAGISAPSGGSDVKDGLVPNTYNFNARLLSNDIAASDLGWVGSAKCLGCHEEYVKGWSATGHALSGHNATGLDSAGCAQCHNPGANLNYNNPIFQPTSVAVLDDGITCESCHGSGKNHVAAPSATNIFNPGTKDILRQTIECGRCHDMYTNTLAKTGTDTFGTGINNTSGSGSVPVGVYTTQGMYDLAKAGTAWTPAFRVSKDDPAKFAGATQLKAASTHFGGAWGYLDSKHFLGINGTITDPKGVVSCNTCHDMHSEKNAGALKYSYEQVCSSCHDASANLAIGVAMPTNSWQRHQLEGKDFSHSFKFTAAQAPIVAATATQVNLEAGDSNTGKTYEISAQATKTFLADFDVSAAKKARAMFPAFSGRNAGIGFKLMAFSDAGVTSQVYNNYAGKFELIQHPNNPLLIEGPLTNADGTANLNVDYEFIPETGAVEFNTTDRTFNTAAIAGNPATVRNNIYTLGTWKVKWTSYAYPTVSVTSVFDIVYE